MTLNFNIEQIEDAAKQFLKSVNLKVILFYGEMGVGKTTFIAELVKQLGGKAEVSSPTFSILNEYEVENDLVYHFDFYRIENEYEALDIGVEEYFDSGHWVFIEWPDKINGILPLGAEYSYISVRDNGNRLLELKENIVKNH
ncbi:MAG: tRNA (adenosine(37)-N6)-threonylcarbamoyltransferase complex ATPase subunit type 1 TsaE [Bacteroidia bacterium]|nr:tRNA (adenosine(37)-N6)-threonylcarbamoyltransferase complex ATPase subunit type 1 TsaE [Bacteroidia bacterium]